MASLKKDVFKPIVFPGLGGDKSASKTNAFFTLQFISGYLIRKCLRAIPTIFVQFLTIGRGGIRQSSISQPVRTVFAG